MNRTTLVAFAFCAMMVASGFTALLDSSPGNNTPISHGTTAVSDVSAGTFFNTSAIQIGNSLEYLSTTSPILSGTPTQIEVWSENILASYEQSLIYGEIEINGIGVYNLASNAIRTPANNGTWEDVYNYSYTPTQNYIPALENTFNDTVTNTIQYQTIQYQSSSSQLISNSEFTSAYADIPLNVLTYNGTIRANYGGDLQIFPGYYEDTATGKLKESVGTIWANLSYDGHLWSWDHVFNYLEPDNNFYYISIAPEWNITAQVSGTMLLNITVTDSPGYPWNGYGNVPGNLASQTGTPENNPQADQAPNGYAFNMIGEPIPFSWGYAQVTQPPGIHISENHPVDQAGNQVDFTAAISNTVSPYSVNWTSNGASIGTGAGISPYFNKTGNYTIQATLSTGGENYTSNNLSLEIVPKLAITSLQQTPDPTDSGENATLTAQISGGVGPYTYSWTVNDISLGINSTSAYYIFPSTGNYTVNFTVTDSLGDVARQSYVETTANAPLITLVRTGTPVATIPYKMSVGISGGNGPYAISWTFEGRGTATGQNITHTFDTGGTRTFEVTLRDETGYTIYENYSVDVSLLVSISANQSEGIAPLGVQFGVSVYGGSAYSFNWNFGNNQVSTLESPIESFGVGNYTVTLAVESTTGLGNDTMVIMALPEPISLSYSPAAVNVTQEVHMIGKPAWWTSGPYSISWLLPNGEAFTGFYLNYTFALYTPENNVSVTFTYYHNGTMEYTGYLNIRMKPANISVSFTPPSYVPPETLVSLNASAYAPDSNSFTFSYSIQGNVYLGNPQVYDFQNAGNYSINLTVSDSLGAQKVVSRVIHVESAGLNSSIVIGYSQAFISPVRTFSFTVTTSSPVTFTELTFDGQFFTPTLVQSGKADGTYYDNYSWSINENNYIAGSYPIQFVVYANNGASNSTSAIMDVPNNGNNPFAGISDFISSIGGPFVLLIGIATIIGGIASAMAIAGRNTSEVVIGNVTYKSKPGKPLKEVKK